MQELEKVMKEIDDLPVITDMDDGCLLKYADVEDIIRKHMNDGWIPVEIAPPPIGQRLQATIKHHKWIADYCSDWVPKEEKIVHPEWTEVCEIVSIGAMWFYYCKETNYEKEIAYIDPLIDLSMPVSEIIAWRPFPKPYRREKGAEE